MLKSLFSIPVFHDASLQEGGLNASVLQPLTSSGGVAPFCVPEIGTTDLTPELSGPCVQVKPLYEVGKRVLDVVLSSLLLLFSLPLLLFLAICIKATSPGPVFFRHRRLARGGREFWCYKLRTMVRDAEEQLRQNPAMRAEFEKEYKIKNDPRVTRLGAFLRRTSLDELPQLWNVFQGAISLIGPRPIIAPELSKYGAYGNKLLSVKPGLSGLWQACGRSETSYEQRARIDMLYIDNRSFWLDIRLIVITAIVVLRGRGAC